MRTLSFEPLLPASLWMALAAAAVGLLAWYAWRRPPVMRRWRWTAVVFLMASAVALVLLVLLNPTWVREIPPPAGKPLLNVLVDVSGSMSTRDAPGGAPRSAVARDVASALSAKLENRFEVRVRTFSETSQPAALADLHTAAAPPPSPVGSPGASPGQSTDLAAAIAESLE